MKDQKKVLIVGVGLIGGSFSLALNKDKKLIFGGFDSNKENLALAEKKNIISTPFEDFGQAVRWADLILLTVPVNIIREMLPEALDMMQSHQTIVDFGSTKLSICESVDGHPRRDQFIAAHPIAGTEYSGPSSAFDSLFQEQNLVLCDIDQTNKIKLSEFEKLATSAGFYITKMGAKEHDLHLAYISHLSHISSYVLSHTVLQKEKDGEVILDLAGSGFESTVRLAKSSPAMWSSIFLENKKMILKGISAYKEELSRLELLIKEDRLGEISDYLKEGRRIRKILP